MEIKKGTKWTCIEDVIIGYNLRIFNASENYESPSDNHLTDNSGKVRYVSSAWRENFVAIPASKRSAPHVENRGTTSPNIDKESYFIAGKKKDLQKGLGKVVEAISNEEAIALWDEIFAVDKTQYPMLDKILHKEVENALKLEELNTAVENQFKESEVKEWQNYCEQYNKKMKEKYGEIYSKLNYTQGNRGIHLGNPPLNEKTGVKNDSEKLPYYTVLFKQFPLALKEVIKCSKVGKLKYNDQDMQNFSRVENAETRYKDAMLRHLTESGQVEDMVQFGEITHEAAVVWNALADLEVKLRKNNLA